VWGLQYIGFDKEGAPSPPPRVDIALRVGRGLECSQERSSRSAFHLPLRALRPTAQMLQLSASRCYGFSHLGHFSALLPVDLRRIPERYAASRLRSICGAHARIAKATTGAALVPFIIGPLDPRYPPSTRDRLHSGNVPEPAFQQRCRRAARTLAAEVDTGGVVDTFAVGSARTTHH
jgi:hypothetical protein